jgi:hypothetical protein
MLANGVRSNREMLMAKRIRTALWFCVTLAMTCLWQQGALLGEETGPTVKLESGLYYTVEKGDTLWNIAQQFYDVPWVWADLWERNPQITNPNWIYPGERIRLFWREELASILGPEEGTEPGQGVPQGLRPYYLFPAIDSVGFMREQAVSPSGAIFKVQEDKVMISEGDLVYVRPMEDATLREGECYSVYRILKPLREKGARELIGFQHHIVGVVQITEAEPEFSMARVVQSFENMEINDLIMPYEARPPEIGLAKSKEGLEGEIVLSERHQHLIGDYNVVFIDRGRKDGVRVGQTYSVYYQERQRLDPERKESILLPPVDFGKILILRTEEAFATAVVTKADKAIYPGAKIRTPAR